MSELNNNHNNNNNNINNSYISLGCVTTSPPAAAPRAASAPPPLAVCSPSFNNSNNKNNNNNTNTTTIVSASSKGGEEQQIVKPLSVEPILSERNSRTSRTSRASTGDARRRNNFQVEDTDYSCNNNNNNTPPRQTYPLHQPDNNKNKNDNNSSKRQLQLTLSPSVDGSGSKNNNNNNYYYREEEEEAFMNNEHTVDDDNMLSPFGKYAPPLPPLTNFILRDDDDVDVDADDDNNNNNNLNAGKKKDGSPAALTEDEKQMIQRRVELPSGGGSGGTPAFAHGSHNNRSVTFNINANNNTSSNLYNGSMNIFAVPRFEPYSALLPDNDDGNNSTGDSDGMEEGGNHSRHSRRRGRSSGSVVAASLSREDVPPPGENSNSQFEDIAGGAGPRKPKHKTRTASFAVQLGAILRRSFQQYWRQKIGLVIEILSPLVFVLLIIILNAAAGKDTFPATTYFTEKGVSDYVAADFYANFLCYDNRSAPIPTLEACTGYPNCTTEDEGGIPVKGICTRSTTYSTNAVLLSFIHSTTNSIVALPSLDEMIMYQWLAKKGGYLATSAQLSALSALQSLGMGVSGKTRYNSITYGGLLYFGPRANVPDDLVAYLESRSKLFPYVYGGIFDTDAEAAAFLKAQKEDDATSSLNATWAYISIGSLEGYFDVEVQMHGGALPAKDPIVSLGYPGEYSFDGSDMYIASGFSTLQQILYDYFLSKARNESAIVTSYVPERVYPTTGGLFFAAGKSYNVFSMASILIAFILVLSYLYPFSQMTRRLVLEKELRIREAMLIMGLRKSSLWCSVVILYFLEVTVITLLLTVLLCATTVRHCNPFLIFCIFYLFALTLIPLSCLVSTLFSKARLASLLSPLIYFVISIPVFVMTNAKESVVLGVSVFSPTALASLLSYAMNMENGDGFGRKDIAHNPLLSPRPYKIMIMLAADFFIYFLIMFYLDAVVPQEWGSTRHPLFFIIEPFRALRRCCSRCCCGDEDEYGEMNGLEGYRYYDDDDDDGVEEAAAAVPAAAAAAASGAMLLPEDTSIGKCGPHKTKKVAVQVHNLVKQFRRAGKRFKAVDNVCWKMYKGDISVLLGPNGAGKSTIINMITGMVMPDKGDCIIAGHSVRRQLDEVRHSVGYCPQHNILWPDLTCREHLEFFAKIKGIRGAALEEVVQDALAAVDLRPCVNQTPGTLSGGQKRKLSVAIAFAGRNQVVLLDEPTAGMDAGARRHTWSLLRSMAARHTILLTTHFMDEADLLGDHIAVVSNGKLQCAGSPQHLRREAGSGYLLHFDLRPILTRAQLGQTATESPEQLSDRQRRLEARWLRIEQLVLSQVPVATVALRTDTEVEYFLPLACEPLLPNVLRVLEEAGAATLGTRAFTLTAPTLEDAFINVVEGRVPELREAAAQAALQMKQYEQEQQQVLLSGNRHASMTVGGLASPLVSAATPVAHSWARRLSRSAVCFDGAGVEASLPASAVAPRGSSTRHRSTTPNRNVASTGEDMPSLMAVLPGSSIRSRRDKPSPQTILSQVRARKDGATGLLPVGVGVSYSADNSRSNAQEGEGASASTTVAEGVVLFSKEKADQQLGLLWQAQSTVSTAALLNLQFRAMLKKRLFFALRDRRMQFFQIVCPVLCILLAMLLQLVQDDSTFSMVYTPSMYKQPHLLDTGGCDAFYGDLTPYTKFPYDTYAFAQAPSDKQKSTTYDSGLYDLLLHNSSSFGTAVVQDTYLNNTYSNHSSPRYGSVYCNDLLLTSIVQQVSSTAMTPGQTVYHYGYNTSSHHSLPQTMASHHYLVYLGGLKAANRLDDTTATISDRSTTSSAMFRLKLSSLPKASGSSSRASSSTTSILISVIVLIPFTFLPANPVAWVVREKEIQARHQQRISGLRYAIYWLSNFCFDYIAYLISLLLVFIIFVIFHREEFVGKDNVGAALLSFLLYGLCFCWCTYAVSFVFREHTTAQMVVLGTSFLSGFILVLLVFVLNLMQSTQHTAKILRWVFRPVPSYAIGEVILNLAFLSSNQLTDATLTAWSLAVTGYPMVFLGAEFVFFCLFTLFIDHPSMGHVGVWLRTCWCSRAQKKPQPAVPRSSPLEPPLRSEEVHPNQETDTVEGVSANGSIIVLPGDVSSKRRASAPGAGAPPPPPQPLVPSDLAHAPHLDPDEINLTPSAHNSSVRGRRRPSLVYQPYGTGCTPSVSHTTAVESGSGAMAPYGDTPLAEWNNLSHRPSQHHARLASQAGGLLALNTSGSVAPVESLAATYQLPVVLAPLPQSPAAAANGADTPVHRLVLDQAVLVACTDEPMYTPKLLQPSDKDILVEDIDVADERAAVYADERRHQQWKQSHDGGGGSDPTNRDVVRVVDLRKVYTSTHRVAVRELSFGVMPREVFGFLGTNGAGKTSALSILAQRQQATSGRAYVCGYDVERESGEAQQKIGFCPQFDTCYDLLTVQEHVDLYAAIRGFERAQRRRILPALLDLMGLQVYKDVLSKDLSGGNRRKLSVAMSLLGMPEVVCLDEPSAGMDPLARRMMWRVLERVSRQCAIVLTTHHLEEVEALADTVAILAQGSLRCIGDLTHLKHKFANNAYELIIRVQPPGRRPQSQTPPPRTASSLSSGGLEKEGGQPVLGERQGSGSTAEGAGCQGSLVSNPLHCAAAEKEDVGGSPAALRAAGPSASITYDGVEMIDLNTDVVLFMQTHFPAALLLENFCDERYVYSLPTSDAMAAQMQLLQASQVRRSSAATPMRRSDNNKKKGFCTADVLAQLQAHKQELHITEYSLSLVSLEQVFLRVTSDEGHGREEGGAPPPPPPTPHAARERRDTRLSVVGGGRRRSSLLFDAAAAAAAAAEASTGGAPPEQSLHAARLSLMARGSMAALSLRPDIVVRAASLPAEPLPLSASSPQWSSGAFSLSRREDSEAAFGASVSGGGYNPRSSRGHRRVAARPVGEPASPAFHPSYNQNNQNNQNNNSQHESEEEVDLNNNNNNSRSHGNYTFAQFRRMRAQA